MLLCWSLYLIYLCVLVLISVYQCISNQMFAPGILPDLPEFACCVLPKKMVCAGGLYGQGVYFTDESCKSDSECTAGVHQKTQGELAVSCLRNHVSDIALQIVAQDLR